MTTIHTAHGVGEVIDTVRERGGRVSYKVKIGLDEIWVKQGEVLSEPGVGGENLFSYAFTPDQFQDPTALQHGASVFAMGSRGFTNMEPAKSVRGINRPYPYDPTPQYPVDMFTDQTIQPGEQEIDADKRTSPAQPGNQRSSPGPSPALFATGAYSVMRQRPEIVAGPQYPHPGDEQDVGWDLDQSYAGIPDHVSEEDDSPHHPGHWGGEHHHGYAGDPGNWDRPTPEGSDQRDYPRQLKDPVRTAPQLREDDEPVYPYDKVSPGGTTTHEMNLEDPGENWYSCPGCGAWHNEFRHQHDRRKARPPRSDDIFLPDWAGRRGSVLCADCREGGGLHRRQDDGGRHRAPRFSDPKDLAQPHFQVYDIDEWAALHPPEGHPDHPDFVTPPKGPKHRAAGLFDLDMPSDMDPRYAYIPSANDYRDPVQTGLAAITRQANILEGELGLDPRVGQYMTLVDRDAQVREAAWRDVQAKAKRLRAEGRVQIKESNPEAIYATVDGDNGTYDTIIVRGNVFDLGGQSVTSWHCGCDWGRWAFKRRLTYVGRFCSHAYATYLEMRSAHDVPGTSTTRTRKGGVVEDFKSWAKDNDQPTDVDSVANFVTQPDFDERLTAEQVAQLYDYAEDHSTVSPQREFDVPYTFDHDKVYKDAREMLRTQPHNLTPTLQFVPEGEDEHLVDVTEDDRKTTGPGQIMHEGGIKEYEGDRTDTDPYDHGYDEDEDDLKIEHFSSVLPPFLAETQNVSNPVPGSPANPRPDAGESTRDLNKLRNLIDEPLSQSFGDMDSRNDEVRDLVDDLHDGGVDASPIAASRQFTADGDFLEPGGGGWADLPFAGSGPDPKWWFSTSADYVDEHERPRFQDVTTADGDILKYNDTDGPVTSPKEASAEDRYRSHYAHVQRECDANGWPYPGDLLAYLSRQADLFSNETSSMAPMGPNLAPQEMGEVNGAPPMVNPGDNIGSTDEPSLLANRQYYAGDALSDPFGGAGGEPILPGGGFGAGAGDFAKITGPAGAGAGDFTAPTGGGGAGAGDFVSTQPADKLMSAGHMPSIKDSIRERNARAVTRGAQSVDSRYAFETSTMPPGWGDVPNNPEDDQDPLPAVPGMEEAKDLYNQFTTIPGMPGGSGGVPGKGGPGGGGLPGGMPGGGKGIPLKVPPVASRQGYAQASDASDIVREFQASAGQAYLRGGDGGGGGGGSRSAAMAGYGGGGGGRGRFSDGDIAGAASAFLQRTAGRT